MIKIANQEFSSDQVASLAREYEEARDALIAGDKMRVVGVVVNHAMSRLISVYRALRQCGHSRSFEKRFVFSGMNQMSADLVAMGKDVESVVKEELALVTDELLSTDKK